MITNSVDEAILLSDRILALGRGPAASLSVAAPVTLARPRAADWLLHDEGAVRMRANVAELLTAGARSNCVPDHAAGEAVARAVPVEA
jgi:nitrate/nitrite transport system ATP-binding protein